MKVIFLIAYFAIYNLYLDYKEKKLIEIISKDDFDRKKFIENIFDVLMTSSLVSVLGILVLSFVI